MGMSDPARSEEAGPTALEASLLIQIMHGSADKVGTLRDYVAECVARETTALREQRNREEDRAIRAEATCAAKDAQVEDWRTWVGFVLAPQGISDADLRARVCAAWDALTTDAERYRYLRSKRRRSEHEETRIGWIHVARSWDCMGEIMDGINCDRVVDSARANVHPRLRSFDDPEVDHAQPPGDEHPREPGEAIALANHRRAFIAAQEITCAETVNQSDRVIENAYAFIEGVCKIIGYHKPEPHSHP